MDKIHSNEKLREFLLFIQEKTRIKSLELIEKDFYLNFFLSKLNFEEYIFKGGTCLIKIYLNYHRLSEDLDFTFKDQNLFRNKSTKKIKKTCEEKIKEFGKQLEILNLDFKFDKSDKKYIEIGSNNKLVTFKVWYNSLFTNIQSFIKIQINFIEIINFSVKKKPIIFLLDNGISEEEAIYFQDFLNFYKKRDIYVYDIREIITEKLRSLLTRKFMKIRDVADLFFIHQEYKIKLKSLFNESKEKLIFAINNYKKYKENFKLIKKEIYNFEVSYDKIKEFIIKRIEKKEFDEFILNLKNVLNELVIEI